MLDQLDGSVPAQCSRFVICMSGEAEWHLQACPAFTFALVELFGIVLSAEVCVGFVTAHCSMGCSVELLKLTAEFVARKYNVRWKRLRISEKDGPLWWQWACKPAALSECNGCILDSVGSLVVLQFNHPLIALPVNAASKGCQSHLTTCSLKCQLHPGLP